ncbi:hypothetical protein [Microbulbifer discodermiae]|uniref:hypothetical protein n=1 Tax=Microbulbifer sp. 2201CG32-9 TaxID=3232309 RepID=UPI00345BA862
MTLFTTSSARPVEEALPDYECHQDNQREITQKDIEAVAEFIEYRLLKERGVLSKAAVHARELFADAMADQIDSLAGNSDSTGPEHIGLLAIHDAVEAGFEIQEAARNAIAHIAEEHFEEFSAEARCWGWLE